MENRYYPVIIGFLLLGLLSCGPKNPEPVIPERKEIDPSPTEVVQEFLKALKAENFDKAYKYVYVPYSDKLGYVNQMKNTVSANQVSIVSYKILGTQIYDRTSIVVAEITIKRNSPKTGSLVERTQRSQYDLGLFEDAWKITNDKCIKNCVEKEAEVQITE
ncbi:MAG: hypothetical protein RIG61_00495 [Deltaproteobacteria bacterium]